MSNANELINGTIESIGDVSIKLGGLTKREHFSGLAMQGLLSCDIDNELTVEDVAITAIQLTDALLKELGK